MILNLLELQLGSFEPSSSEIGTGLADAGGTVESAISLVLGLATTIAGLVFLTMFVLGAYNMMTAGGDSGKFASARNRIIQATIGLLVIVSAYAVVGVIGGLLGLDILNLGSQFGRPGSGETQGPEVPVPTFQSQPPIEQYPHPDEILGDN